MNDQTYNPHSIPPNIFPPLALQNLGIQLIGITGHAGVGKDTVADWIEMEYTDVYTESFADPLKQACAQAFGIDWPQFYSREHKEKKNEFWGVSPREIAQFVGTELFRDHIYKLSPRVRSDFWIWRMYGKLSGECRNQETDGDYVSGDTVIIPDLRFQNEYDFVISQGGLVIRLLRPGCIGSVGIEGHRSEAGIQQLYAPDQTHLIINDSDKETLYAQVRKVTLNSHLKLIPKSIVSNL